MIDSNHHESVLFNESIEGLNIKANGIYVDATLGRCGHSSEILKNLGSSGRLIGLDQDVDAIEFAKSNITDSRLTTIHTNFSNLNEHLIQLKLLGKVDGIFMDLGISSPQVDNAERGFSFNKDGMLDMRMDQTQSVTAASWLRDSSQEEIANTLYHYGEEKRSRIIASTIKEYQKTHNLNSTIELANLISTVVRPGKKKTPSNQNISSHQNCN